MQTSGAMRREIATPYSVVIPFQLSSVRLSSRSVVITRAGEGFAEVGQIDGV